MDEISRLSYNGFRIQKKRGFRQMKAKSFVAIGLIFCFICGAIGLLYRLQDYDAYYYTQIDNSKVKKLPANSDMPYEYSLDCYGKNGKRKKLTFKTYRILREDAYLLLEVRAFGVYRWEEVQPGDLPPKVRDQYRAAG